MMRPNASQHNPDPAYLRGLIDRAGISQREAARLIGITDRALRYYLTPEEQVGHRSAPYPVQFAIECLATEADKP